jgi:hypothetical protein
VLQGVHTPSWQSAPAPHDDVVQVQAPATQLGVTPEQTAQEGPQCDASEAVHGTQRLPSQTAPAAQSAVNSHCLHAPSMHFRPAAQGWHDAPQAVSVTHVEHLPLTQVAPAPQDVALHEHLPPTQSGIAPPQTRQALPQWSGSVAVHATQRLSSHVSPAGQFALDVHSMHLPFWH